jgi:Na+-translocating ferredoxin:NAD+ oxidoreductase RnfC subunit
MNETMLVNKKMLKQFKAVKKIQKATLKNSRKIKSKNLKAKLGKFVALDNQNSFIDLSQNHQSIIEKDLPNLSNEELLLFIKDKNILGMSGSCFPLARKLETALNAKTQQHILIVNAIECEPSLVHDRWLLKNKTIQIEKTIALIEKLGFDKIIIATKAPVNDFPISKYTIVGLADRYPIGSEHILVKELLDIDLSPSDIPAKQGIAIVNVQTIYSLYESLITNQKPKGRFITVLDIENAKANVVYTEYNTSINSIAKQIINKSDDIVCGGGLFFGHKANVDEVVLEGTCFIGYSPIFNYDNDGKCKMCGGCSKYCPQHLKVSKIVHYMRENNIVMAKTFNPELCLQCGTCSFVCPAGKNLMSIIAKVKE